MATRVVEGKKPYTGGKAISIDENKVISLNLRDENNLIIYDEGDNEIYVDLQLDDEITPTSAFPIGVNVGRVIVDNGWDKPGTIISAETTSGDNIKIFYADEGTLWIDNGTGTFKQIYFKADVDTLLSALRNYIDGELAKKQNGVSSDTAPENPSEGDLWYDTTNNAMKVWDGTAWQSVGTGGGSDIVYATQAEYNALLPGAASDGKHYFIYTSSGGSRLPSEYQEVEYIDGMGSGTSGTYIDTGFKPDNNSRFIVDYQMLGEGAGIIGCYNNPSNYGMIILGESYTWTYSAHRGTQYSSFIGTGGSRMILDLNKNNLYKGDTLMWTAPTTTFQMNINAWLFGWNRDGVQSNNYGARLWSCQIYDDGTLVRDFVPCYRKADDEIGLYDLVNDVFYTNSGTGAFTKGPNV